MVRSAAVETTRQFVEPGKEKTADNDGGQFERLQNGISDIGSEGGPEKLRCPRPDPVVEPPQLGQAL